jgi:hypothetical protein
MLDLIADVRTLVLANEMAHIKSECKAHGQDRPREVCRVETARLAEAHATASKIELDIYEALGQVQEPRKIGIS